MEQLGSVPPQNQGTSSNKHGNLASRVCDPASGKSCKAKLKGVQQAYYLVKVPKYVANRWNQLPENAKAGQIKFYESEERELQRVTLRLSDATLNAKEDGEGDIPEEHELVTMPIGQHTLMAFDVKQRESAGKPDSVTIRGSVQKKWQCKPNYDSDYVKLKRAAIEKANKPNRVVMKMNANEVGHFGKSNTDTTRVSTPWADYRVREDKAKIEGILFKAFEEKPRWSFKDLLVRTNQTGAYLKEVLGGICNHSESPRGWEMKPEFRHYENESKNYEE